MMKRHQTASNTIGNHDQMIEIKNLYKRYHNHHGSDWVLKDINLTIPKGVSVGLIGPNGAGKSTLLRLIAGMDTPDRGEVIRHSRVSWPVGLSGGMQGNMTGRQNAKFVARAQGSSPAEIKQVIAFVEEFAEIGEAFDEPIRTYSSGMRSRVSFGLSLAFDFDVYISDEATAVGDRAFKAKAKELFKNKVGQASLIMVSHGEGILRDLCEAGIYLKQGSAFWYDDINDAIAAYHNDVDALSAGAVTEGELPNINAKQLTAEQIRVIKARQKETKQYVNGLASVVKLVKTDGWGKNDLNVLKGVHQTAKDDLNAINDIIRETPDAQIRLAKGEVAKYQNSLKSINRLMENDEQSVGSDEMAVLLKAKKYVQKRLGEAEAELEALEGDD